jgi:hypothetical protein
VIAGIVWSSLEFQQCVEAYGQNYPAAQHLEKGISVFVRMIPTYRHCVGAYVTDKNTVITALGTVVIAVFTTILGIFTISLARSTRIAANAAKVSADAAVASERPRVYLSRLIFSRWGGDIRDRERMPQIEIGFKNFGRSVAVMIDIRIVMKITETLPEKPDYGLRRIYIPTGFSLIEGEEWILDKQRFFDFNPTEHNSPDTTLPWPFKATFWVYGYVAYRDHLGDERRHGFVDCWVPPDVHSVLGDTSGKHFIRCDIPNYTYDT